MLRSFWTTEKNQTIAALGMNLQAANLLLARLGQPGNDSADSVGLDQLFCHPQPLRWRVGLNPDQVALIQAFVGQAGHIRLFGGRHQQHLTTGSDHPAQRRPQQAPFED